ncbi:polyhydroxyalkanoate depolymerase [Methylobacterium durans]|uniref:polyhydroxyalkanoate depolymerase n=1 Tax=Methylobacterium durans TaxID=2202825 RepID=UPI002AFE8D76|nr:polyhydroxyalkanoate depolymerase [Methylobacterium durans]MEA1831534.1 polyhydroxyalkanoate depolymerase [Methylobacterium durans]
MLYLTRDTCNLMLAPARLAADAVKLACDNPFNPFALAPGSRMMAASCEMFERATRTYAKPVFDLGVPERVVFEHPFCRVVAFGEAAPDARRTKPKLLLVAPMSGHYATLLHGTVEAFLDTHQVFITDWLDAKDIPVSAGRFGLDDYVDLCITLFSELGPDLNVAAVCQPSVPVLAALSRMEAENHPRVPRTATFIGGPIDTRVAPTAVNRLAEERGFAWFEQHCIHTVPWSHAGRGRAVYPGFLQLGGFMSMNLDRHLSAHWDMFNHLVEGDGDSATKHRAFYDEYLAVMDLTAEFYLETIRTVFIDHALPQGRMLHRGRPVDPSAIRRCAIMAVEGEKDDITGVGQTRAVLDLTPNLAAGKKAYHLQPGAGHYGIFNGTRFRTEIAPKLAAFMAAHARPIERRKAADRPILLGGRARPAPQRALVSAVVGPNGPRLPEPKAGSKRPDRAEVIELRARS